LNKLLDQLAKNNKVRHLDIALDMSILIRGYLDVGGIDTTPIFDLSAFHVLALQRFLTLGSFTIRLRNGSLHPDNRYRALRFGGYEQAKDEINNLVGSIFGDETTMTYRRARGFGEAVQMRLTFRRK
jgi:hypothetical protein